MSNDDLTLFSYEIMALVGRGGAGPHDLKRMVERGRFFQSAGESRYYVEPKRLAKLGYLAARKEPGKTHARTVYALTDKGLDALRRWAREPVHFPRLQHEPATRLLATDLVGEEAVRDSLQTLHADLDELEKQLDQTAVGAELLPHRTEYLLLNIRLARLLIKAHRDWLDEVDRALTPGTDT